MNSISRTTIVLDHSLQARKRACHDSSKASGGASDDSDDEFDLEPCSMWSSFIHASLHYARLAWDLSPVGQRSQVSIHAAPGPVTTRSSAIMNTWTTQEQNLAYISSSLRAIQQLDDADQERTPEDYASMNDWIGPALQGAISHILEPIHQQLSNLSMGQNSATPATAVTHSSTITPGVVANIIILLVDPEDSREEGEDTDMDTDDNVRAWRYGDLDLREVLTEALNKLQDYIKTAKVVNIHMDFIRISTLQRRSRADIVGEDISKICTASVYTVVSEDESSVEKALVNHYLLQNKDIQLLRVQNLPLKQSNNRSPVDLFYRSDHIRVSTTNKSDLQDQDEEVTILQNTPRSTREMTELTYGVECEKGSQVLPTQCAHVASISPSTFVTSFFPFVKGTVHLLKTLGSNDVVPMVLFDHDGQLFVHCLHTSADPHTFSSEATLSASKRRLDTTLNNSQLEEFVEVIIRPNTIVSGADSFERRGNVFTEITPFAMNPTNATLRKDDDIDKDQGAEEELSSQGVNMALVHTTSKLDLETRWLVQWEGERMHPILPTHSILIQKFRSAICKTHVDRMGLGTIVSVVDTLIGDARPLVLPGEMSLGGISPQQQRFRDSAQAILADLWMIGQRFKSVSQSHVEAAKLIGTKITPKGLDHNTVKLTFVPPNRRAAVLSGDSSGGSPNVDGGDTGGDGRNRNKNSRGGGNIGGSIGRGGGGGRGGRFENNRGGRGGGPMSGGRGRGGFRGVNNNTSVGGGGAGTDDMSFGGSVAGGGSAVPSTIGPNGDVMVSMQGKTQPTPYLATQPPTREEIEESEQEYLAQLGDDGCLLKAYWGSRGTQGSSIAAVLNSITSLDSPTASSAPSTAIAGVGAPGSMTPIVMDPLTAVAVAAQQKMKKLATKRPRLQDFAGRTPVSENGGADIL